MNSAIRANHANYEDWNNSREILLDHNFFVACMGFVMLNIFKVSSAVKLHWCLWVALCYIDKKGKKATKASQKKTMRP